jgi:hypothetical protein
MFVLLQLRWLFIGKIQRCEKVEVIGNHRSYNGRSGVWKQWRTFRFWFRSIQSKILLTKQRYGGCSFSWRTALWILRTFLQKLTTGPVTIEQRLSDSWVALLIVVNNCKRIVLQEGTKLRSKTFLFKLIPGKTAACYFAATCFIWKIQKEIKLLSRKSYILAFCRYMY